MNAVEYEVSAEEAFGRRRAELEAVPARDVMRVNLDPLSVVGVVLRAEPRIRSLRPEFVRHFREYKLELTDGLRDYALCLFYTETLYLTKAKPVRCPPDLLNQAKLCRARLLQFLNTCAERRFVDKARFSQLRGTNGYRNVASDLGVLTSVALDMPAFAEFERLLPPGELRRADLLGRQLLTIAGKHEVRSEELSAAREMRARAFTLLIRSYNEVRRGVAYVRAEQGDAEAFAPTLFGKAPRRRSRAQKAKPDAESSNVFVDESPEKVDAQGSSALESSAAGERHRMEGQVIGTRR
jgi:hypothetical protein